MKQRMGDLDPGDQFWFDGRRYVIIDTSCEFAEGLPKSAVVQVGTGVIKWFGTDNEVEPIHTIVAQGQP